MRQVAIAMALCAACADPSDAEGTAAGTSGATSTTSTSPTSTSVDASSTASEGDTTTSSTGEGVDTTSETTASTSQSTGESPLGPSPGCGSDPVTVLGGTIDVDGTVREYMLVLPDGYDHDTPYPLVFGWHGLGGHSELAQSIYQLETYWPEPAIVVYPQGLPQVGPDTGWDLNENGVDMAFFDAMATSFANELCIDLDRIYTMGFSFGAYMSNHLACYRGDYLRGMAAVSGGGPFPGDACQGPVAAMIVHGTEDNVVPYAEGEASRDRWLAEDGCGMDTMMWLPDDAKQMPECFDYQGCDAGAPVTWCSHIWQHVWRPWMNVEIPAFLAGL